MSIKKKQVNLILAIHEFQNINLCSKGFYKLKVKARYNNTDLNIKYRMNDDLQKQKPDITHHMSINRMYSSEFDLELQKNLLLDEFQEQNTLISQPFYVKYHGQKIKLKSIAFFHSLCNEDKVHFDIELMKKETKNIDSQIFQKVQKISFYVKCFQNFIQMKSLMLSHPQCSAIKFIIFSCPIIHFDQINQTCELILKQNKKILLGSQQKQKQIGKQIRKQIKKQRYQTFLIKKELQNVCIKPQIEIIKLPLHFIQKDNPSMNQVQTNEILFFKYCAFYEKCNNISVSMLKQQVQNINFQKKQILKYLIQQCQTQQILIGILQQKQKQLLKKKLKRFMINITHQLIKPQFILSIYSNDQYKLKKQKIKKLQKHNISNNQIQFQYIFQQNKFIINQEKLQCKKQIKNVSFGIQYPIVFRDIYLLDQYQRNKNKNQINYFRPTKQIKKKKKIFIFAHGFQGMPIDMICLVNMVKFKFQKAKFLILKSYKNQMTQSIEIMAHKVSLEIKTYFQTINLKEIQPQIIFIGHSMGSIILRAAFLFIKQYFCYFHSFISICSPHLGYMQGTKFLTETGLSLISKLKPIQSLSQLSNRDNNDLQKTFIYKLSKQGTLSMFKRLYLISSSEDKYVPWHSARIQPYSQQNSLKQKIQKQMISNILGLNQTNRMLQRIEKIQINFKIQNQRFLNFITGRTCHIKPLNDRGFLQIFVNQILFD